MRAIRNIVRELGATVSDFAFPPICAGCEQYVESGDVICRRCLDSILLLDEPTCLFCDAWLVDQSSCPECEHTIPLFAMGQYGSVLERMIVNLKFHSVTPVAEVLTDILLELHGRTLAGMDCDVLVPLPLSVWRQYRRGYNQAELVADRIGEALDIEIDLTVLQRRGLRRPQSRLKLQERAGNVKDVFEAEPTSEPMRLILVDDVVTSGSTMREAVRTAEAAGHTVVAVAALARA